MRPASCANFAKMREAALGVTLTGTGLLHNPVKTAKAEQAIPNRRLRKSLLWPFITSALIFCKL
jgi:hypothetical protein